jgi:hypothetical protein
MIETTNDVGALDSLNAGDTLGSIRPGRVAAEDPA